MFSALFTSFLSILFGLKLIVIAQAVRWMIKHGDAYTKDLIGLKPNSQEACFQLLTKHRGNRIFPAGFKDYLWRSGGFLPKSFQFVFFSFPFLILILIFYLPVSVWAWHTHRFNQPAWLICVLVVLALLGNIALAIEAIVSYTFLGSYGVVFHMRLPGKVWDYPSLRFEELKVFAGQFAVAVITSSLAIFALSSLFTCSFKGLQNICAWNPFPWQAFGKLIVDCTYFAISTLFTVGYGDISPISAGARSIAMLIMIQGFMLIIAVFASLQSIRLLDMINSQERRNNSP
jgi:hypothetical protein